MMLLVAFVSCWQIFYGMVLLAFGAQHTASSMLLALIVPSVTARACVYIGAGLMPWMLRGWRYAVAPQQVVLILGAVSAFMAIAAGEYADGVERPIAFIALDQGIYIVMALFHLVALGKFTTHQEDL